MDDLLKRKNDDWGSEILGPQQEGPIRGPLLAMNDPSPQRPFSMIDGIVSPKNMVSATASKPKPAPAPDIKPSTDLDDDSDSDRGGDDLSQYYTTKDDLQNASAEKRRNTMLGAISDNLSNRQSFGNFFLGKMNPQNSSANTVKALNDQADDGIKQKQALLKQAQEKPVIELNQQLDDPSSQISDTKRSILGGIFQKLGMDTRSLAGMSARELDKVSDSSAALKEEVSANSAYQKTLAMTNMAEARIAAMGAGNPRLAQGDQRIHNANVTKLNSDKNLNDLFTTSNNLQNAISNFEKGGGSPQEFMELQQAVRSNTGIKGAGGISEREETYLHSLGINKDKFLQFVTGNTQSVLESDPVFAKQIIGLAKLDLGNKKTQADDLINQLSEGHKSFYNSHEDLKADYDDTIKRARSRIKVPSTEAAGKPKTVTQNGHTYTLNPETGKYE